MGEIKSTLEIALEKAGAMEISSEDRKRFKDEEIHSRARDLFHRYMEHPTRSQSLREAIRQSGEDAPWLENELRERFLQALHPSRDSERIWEGFRELGLEDPTPFREALSRIAGDLEKGRREAAGKAEERLRHSLSALGISGTAVDPNVEASDPWRNMFGTVEQRATAEIDRLRQEIARAMKTTEKDSNCVQ